MPKKGATRIVGAVPQKGQKAQAAKAAFRTVDSKVAILKGHSAKTPAATERGRARH